MELFLLKTVCKQVTTGPGQDWDDSQMQWQLRHHSCYGLLPEFFVFHPQWQLPITFHFPLSSHADKEEKQNKTKLLNLFLT